ncbi:divalent cation transporter [Bryobacterales bacterium F-183]|nr:divalent cation transporter [Bryobacterales bacterium F-183]
MVLTASSLAIAQTKLTPADAVRLALDKNQFLTAAANRIDSARGQALQAGLKPNTRLFLQVENARPPVSSPFRYESDTDNFAYLSRVFEAGGKRQRRAELGQENVKGAERSLDLQRAQVAVQVLNAYWNAAGARRLAQVLGDSLAVLGRTVEYHRIRVNEGALPEADLLRVQLEYQQVAIAHRNAEQDAKRLLQLLFREIGAEPDTAIELSGDLLTIDPPIDPGDLDTAIDRRPDVKLVRQSTEQAQANLRLQKANAVPDPEALFGYKRTMGLNTTVAGLQINLPFNNRNQGAIAAAAADVTAAGSTLRAARIAARTEIDAALGEYRQKRDLVEQMLPTLSNQANETRRIADAVYREGASDLLRLLDAERVRIQAETQQVRSLIDLRLASVSLQSALGLLP